EHVGEPRILDGHRGLFQDDAIDPSVGLVDHQRQLAAIELYDDGKIRPRKFKTSRNRSVWTHQVAHRSTSPVLHSRVPSGEEEEPCCGSGCLLRQALERGNWNPPATSSVKRGA